MAERHDPRGMSGLRSTIRALIDAGDSLCTKCDGDTCEACEFSGLQREAMLDAQNRGLAARCERLDAELAKVTAERDEARRMAEIRLRAIESMRRAALRYTPARGDR